MDIYALARGMGTEGTFVEAPAPPRGLTGVLASAVDPEGPSEVFWSPVPLWLYDFNQESRRLMASVLWTEASRHPNLDRVTRQTTNRIYTSIS